MEEKLKDINDNLLSLSKCDPSPGLNTAIKVLTFKQEIILDSLELWKGFAKTYPNYNR